MNGEKTITASFTRSKAAGCCGCVFDFDDTEVQDMRGASWSSHFCMLFLLKTLENASYSHVFGRWTAERIQRPKTRGVRRFQTCLDRKSVCIQQREKHDVPLCPPSPYSPQWTHPLPQQADALRVADAVQQALLIFNFYICPSQVLTKCCSDLYC